MDSSNKRITASPDVARTLRYEGSQIQNSENVNLESIIAVTTALSRDFPRPGNAKDRTIFMINYLIPDDVVSKELRAECIAKVVAKLVIMVPYGGEQVHFLRAEGQSWIETLLQPAAQISRVKSQPAPVIASELHPNVQPPAIVGTDDMSKIEFVLSESSQHARHQYFSDVTTQSKSVGEKKRIRIQLPPSKMLSHASESSYKAPEATATHDTLPTTISSPSDSSKSIKSASFSTHDDKITTYHKPAYTSPAPRTNAGGGYIHGFIQLIAGTTEARNMERTVLERICGILPLYMTAYAQKIGHMAERSRQAHPEVPFIHKHLHILVKRLIDTDWSATSSEDEDFDERKPDMLVAVNAEARTLQWIDALDDDPAIEEWDSVNDHPEGEAEDHHNVDVTPDSALQEDGYKIVSDASAFRWLISMIKREHSLDQAGLARMRECSGTVLRALPEELVSKSRAQLYRVKYVLEFDLVSFLKDQQYDQPMQSAIEAVIVLTGSFGQAQATTCGEYLKQTWPTTGSFLLGLLISVVRDGRAECILPDHTQLSASLNGSKFTVHTYGTRYAVAEVSEQLSWLSSALRSSDDNSGAAFGVSFLKHVDDTYDISDSEPTHIFSIDTSLERVPTSLFGLPGHCWYTLFRTPVLVLDFPIPRRSNKQIGLELPLLMMARLLDTNAVHEFNRSLFIKGFSSILYPTERSEQVLIWHHEFNAQDKYISYADATTEPLKHIDVRSLGLMRHIVGWSKEVKNCAGSPEAAYDQIAECFLNERSGYARIEKLSLSGGKYVTASMSIAVGVKDKPIHQVADYYFSRLYEQKRKFVVLWDLSYERGWLVRSIDALLHLVRTSLEIYRSDEELNNVFLYGSEGYPELQSRKNSFETLHDKDNRGLVVHYAGEDIKYDREGTGDIVEKRSSSYFHLEDLVVDLLDRLEQMDAYQVLAAREDGINLHPARMQGWDFYTTARRDSLIKPLASTIPSHGKGWPKLVRSINATVLFGTKFGEIIRPVAGAVSCKHWSTLPSNHYHLAVTLYDLRQIIDNYHGNKAAVPLKLTGDVFLDSPTEPFQQCYCKPPPPNAKLDFIYRLISLKGREPIYCDPSQNLVGATSGKGILFESDHISLHTKGAVVFRHDRSKDFNPRKVSERMHKDPEAQSSAVGFNGDRVVVSLASSSLQPSQDLPSSTSRLTLTNSNLAAHHGIDTPATSVGLLPARWDTMTQHETASAAIDAGASCGRTMHVSSSESFFSCLSKNSQ